jgi:hypothetical protein
MNPYNFIADMNGLQQEFASLPEEVTLLVSTLCLSWSKSKSGLSERC